MRSVEKIGVGIAMSFGILYVDLFWRVYNCTKQVEEQVLPLFLEPDISNFWQHRTFLVRAMITTYVTNAVNPSR